MAKQGNNRMDKFVMLHHIQRMAIVQVVCIVTYWFMIKRMSRRNQAKRKASATQSVDTIEEIDRVVGQKEVSLENQSTTGSGSANVQEIGRDNGSMYKGSAESCGMETSSKRAKTEGKISKEVEILRQGFESVAEALIKSAALLVKPNRLPKSESEIWARLEELELSDDLVTDACVPS